MAQKHNFPKRQGNGEAPTVAPTTFPIPPPPPTDFLRSPAPHIRTSRIDFAAQGLHEYNGRYAVILDNVLSVNECNTLLALLEGTAAAADSGLGWERAMINAGGGKQMLVKEARDCDRIIWDSQEWATLVWQRIAREPAVQEITRLTAVPLITGTRAPGKPPLVQRFTRPNERLRFLRYVGGEFFGPHCDGHYSTPDRKEKSYMTLHLYLNDSSEATAAELATMSAEEKHRVASSQLRGGTTTFHSRTMDPGLDLHVRPRAGRVLLFQQRDLVHSGTDVWEGVKYTMRTDLMYVLEKDGSESAAA